MRRLMDWIHEHPRQALALAVALVLALALLVRLHKTGPKAELRRAQASDLYTGKEPKIGVGVYFASRSKPMPDKETREIYQTASVTARAIQSVRILLEGPKSPDLFAVFPKGATLLGLFIDKSGLCVVDLSLEASKDHPGGTTGEYLSLYCLVHTLTDNFGDIQRVQVLVGGEQVDSLAGHFDLSAPLDKNSF